MYVQVAVTKKISVDDKPLTNNVDPNSVDLAKPPNEPKPAKEPEAPYGNLETRRASGSLADIIPDWPTLKPFKKATMKKVKFKKALCLNGFQHVDKHLILKANSHKFLPCGTVKSGCFKKFNDSF